MKKFVLITIFLVVFLSGCATFFGHEVEMNYMDGSGTYYATYKFLENDENPAHHLKLFIGFEVKIGSSKYINLCSTITQNKTFYTLTCESSSFLIGFKQTLEMKIDNEPVSMGKGECYSSFIGKQFSEYCTYMFSSEIIEKIKNANNVTIQLNSKPFEYYNGGVLLLKSFINETESYTFNNFPYSIEE